jgi:hypothetical protein
MKLLTVKFYDESGKLSAFQFSWQEENPEKYEGKMSGII